MRLEQINTCGLSFQTNLRSSLAADAGSSWDNSSSISYTQLQPRPRSSHDLKWYQQKNGGVHLIKLYTPHPPAVQSFSSFISFAKPAVNIKLPKPQTARVFECWRWGGVPHFLNICISSSPFVLLLKAAFAPIRGDVAARPPARSLRPTYLHTPLLTVTQQTTWLTHPEQTSRNRCHQLVHMVLLEEGWQSGPRSSKALPLKRKRASLNSTHILSLRLTSVWIRRL